MPRRPRNGLLSCASVRPSIGLSAPASSVRIVTGLPARPFGEPPIGDILLLFVRQAGAATEKEFGPHETDAVEPGEIEGVDLSGGRRCSRRPRSTSRPPSPRAEGGVLVARRFSAVIFSGRTQPAMSTARGSAIASRFHRRGAPASRSRGSANRVERRRSSAPRAIWRKVATWLDALPASKQCLLPGSSRSRESGRASDPCRRGLRLPASCASVCVPLIVARTRSRISDKSLARARK